MYRLRWIIILLCPVLLSGAGIQDMQRRILKARGAPAGEDITSNLEVYYEFEATSGTAVADSSGNSRHGSIVSTGFTWSQTGQVGNALAVVSGTYISTPYGSGIDPSTQSVTVAVWVNLAALPPADGYLYNNTAGTNQRFGVCYRSPVQRWAIMAAAAGCLSNTEFSTATGWSHIVAVYNAATDVATLWVNNVKGTTAQSVVSYASYAIGGDVLIAARAGALNFIPGTYDEYRFYSRALTDAQVTALFNYTGP